MERDPIERFEEFFREKYYDDLLKVAREYPDKKSLVVDYAELDKHDVELADLLLKDPEETFKIAKDALMEIDLPIEGIYSINVRFKNLPSSQNINIRDVRSEHIDHLITLEGLVKSAADVRPEAIRVVYECPDCKKEIVVAQGGKKLKTPFMCDDPQCARKGRFKLLRADLIDTQSIKIQEPPETIIGGEQPSQLYSQLSEDLVSPFERKKSLPGNRVKITGILRKRATHTTAGAPTTRFDLYLEANHIETIEREFSEIELSNKDIEDIKKLSKDKKLYKKFVDSLAPSIQGYEDVKEAILLQLFGGVPKIQPDGTRIRENIHLFLVGDPAVGKSQLLRYVAELSPKGRFVSGRKASGVGLTAAVVRDEFAGGWTLEAGALILANNGVAAVDEFDKMDDDDRSAMLEAMEQGTISIAKAGIVTTLRANTTVLAAANPKYGRFDLYRPLPDQIDLSPVILSRFDVKFLIQDTPGREADEKLADHILNSFISPKTVEPVIKGEFIRKYVAYAKTHCKPKMTREAQKIIKDFYVTWRGKHGGGDSGDNKVALTPRQLEALVRMSEASAKVRLADKVTVEDARRGTRLLEFSLRQLGTEPETGQIDIDRIEAGTSSMQRSKIYTMLTIIEEITKDVGKNVPVEDILKEAKDRGIEELAALELIGKLKEKGDLFEPKPGYLQKA
ncbi:MAG: minichromosome maintenance protein MCM [archaeon]